MNAGTMCRAVWDSGRSFNRTKVEALVAKCRDASPPASARVASVVTKDKKQGRPVPLNTVALLKACSKALGIGPHHALSCAERLYLSGYLSYPRTESTKYPASFDVEGTLRDQARDHRWGSYVTELLRTGPHVGKGGVDMGDHPPITPCRHARAGELSGDQARVYDLVARHFIASVSDDAVWRSTAVGLSIDELEDKGRFTVRGKQVRRWGRASRGGPCLPIFRSHLLIPPKARDAGVPHHYDAQTVRQRARGQWWRGSRRRRGGERTP